MATNTALLPVPVSPANVPTRNAPEERKAALARAIGLQVALGARVESQGDYQGFLLKGERPSHLLVLGDESRMSVAVDEWGNTIVQKL